MIKKTLSTAALSLLLSCLCVSGSYAQEISLSDVDAFQKADATGTREGYQAYLDAFPNGIFKPVAVERARPAILTNLLPRMLPVAAKGGRRDEKDINLAWNEAWDRVRTSDTEAGYLEYLSTYRLTHSKRPGEDVALARYLELSERTISLVPASVTCAVPVAQPIQFNGAVFDKAYPQFALDRNTTGAVLGEQLVSPTGSPLGMVVKFATHDVFVNAVSRSSKQMWFGPARKKCVNVTERFSFEVTFVLDEKKSKASKDTRPNELELIRQLQADTGVQGFDLPADRALLIDLPATPLDRLRVWQIQVNARFPVRFDVYDSAGMKQSVLSDGYVVSHPQCQSQRLRVSAPDVRDRAGRILPHKAYSGPVKLTVSTAYDSTYFSNIGNPIPNCTVEKPTQ